MGDGELSTAKISVWWDIENCAVPKDVDPHSVAQNVSSALSQANLKGPVIINIFGDTKVVERGTQMALSCTGVTMNHVPRGNKDAADKAILVGMLFWALENPPPAHILLISGDVDFANALHRLRMKRYNILLARPNQRVNPALSEAATSVWYWRSLAKGELSISKTHETKVKPLFPQNTISNSSIEPTSLRDVSNFRSGSANSPKEKRQLSVQPAASRSFAVQDSELSKHGVSMPIKARPDYEANTWPQNPSDLASPLPTEKKINLLVASMGAGLVPGETLAPLNFTEPSSLRSAVAQACVQMEARVPFNYNGLPGQCSPLNKTETGPAFTRDIPGFVSGKNTLPHDKYSMLSCLGLLDFVHTEKPIGLVQEIRDSCSSTVAVVYKAMKTLERDMLPPTEENLQHCILYWEKQFGGCSLTHGLETAVKQSQVTLMHAGLGHSRMFVPLNSQLWKYVDVGNMQYEFPEDLWMDFGQFLLCDEEWKYLAQSQSQYEAAQILKNRASAGMQRLLIGQIIHLLNIALQRKKWLRTHMTGWFPLSMNLQAVLDYAAHQVNVTELIQMQRHLGFRHDGQAAVGASNKKFIHGF